MAENKKDSFTFSDKIKNSKPAFNPFSKRASSKIGNNGKPKKTIFERTRRDAPFFIAAAVALLMLPFLYKYSGSVAEEPFVTPGAEDSVFDPERFGFTPTTEDPNGQIAQLSGRDSLSLIKGWGDPDAASSSGNLEDDYGRDGFGGSDYASPSQDTPRNNYRQNAPVQTRASFKRQTTPIKELGGASLNLRGGGGAYGRFGGSNLKSAAKQDSSGGPRQGVKPVSLQPLRAAGNPSRSYFGQGNAAAARASRDAMGKANAQQALNDAMFRPVGPGHAGGNPMTGDFAPGGGAGKWDNKMDYKGITPWWWDMMKDREQKKWEWKYFLWRKNLVEPLIKGLAEVAVTLGKGLACCLLTGADDCAMGSMWGTGEEGKAEYCKCNGKEYFSMAELHEAYGNDAPADQKLDKWCDSEKAGKAKGCEYSAGKPGGNMNFFQVRGHCLGATVKGSIKGATVLDDYYKCKGLDSTHSFQLQAGGEASKWKKYHAVVAKNYNPYAPSKPLCGSSITDFNPNIASGHVNQATGKRGGAAVGRKTSVHLNEDLKPEEVAHYCVIYLAEGDVFHWDTFKKETTNWLQELRAKYFSDSTLTPQQAFNALHLAFIEGYAFKDAFSKTTDSVEFAETTTDAEGNEIKRQIPRDLVGGYYPRIDVQMPISEMPVLYQDFEAKYVLNKDNNPKVGSKYKYKPRVFTAQSKERIPGNRLQTNPDGRENAVRMYCPFANFQIKAELIRDLNTISAILHFDKNMHGVNGNLLGVSVEFLGTGVRKTTPNEVICTGDKDADGNTLPAGQVRCVVSIPEGEDYNKLNTEAQKPQGLTAHWVARDRHGKVSADDAFYYTGEPVPVPPTPHYECGNADDSGQVPDSEKRREFPMGGKTCHYQDCDMSTHRWKEMQVYDRPECQSVSLQCTEDKQLNSEELLGTDGQPCWTLPCVNNQYDWTHLRKDARLECQAQTPPQPPSERTALLIRDFKKLVLPGSNKLTNHEYRQNPQELSDESIFSACRLDFSASLVGWSDDIGDVFTKAQRAYNEANTSTGSSLMIPSVSGNNRPTAAELFDALMLYPGNQVPKNAVCLLGKSIGAAARDPREGCKNSIDSKCSNMFGAFAAFIGADASLYPTSRIENGVCNLNFIGCPAQRSSDNLNCFRGSKHSEEKFHWGLYNVSERTNGTKYNTPDEMRNISSTANGSWWKKGNQFILHELHKGNIGYYNLNPRNAWSAAPGNTSVENVNRQTYWKDENYGKYFQYNGSCGLDGSMSKQAVIDYMKALCEHGDTMKPTNTAGPDSSVRCGIDGHTGTSSPQRS